jgi:hypothetical protein
LILNNTFFENDINQDGNGELWLQYDVKDSQIQNNIFYANAQGLLVANPYTQNQNNVVDYNIYFSPLGSTNSEWQWKNVFYEGFGDYKSGSGNDANSFFADPQLVDIGAPDLHLQSTSQAIDAGEYTTNAGIWDIDGELRIQAGGIDIGADEFLAAMFVYLPLVISD